MKVCLVSSYYPPYVGGIETYVSNLATSLAKRGHSVTVFCSERPLRPGSTFTGEVRVVRFRTPLVLYGAPVGFFPADLLRGDHDVIHANFPNPYFAAAAAWTGAVKEIPAVLTWHNDLPAVTRGASLLVGAHDRVSPIYLNSFRTIIATTNAYLESSKTLQRYSSKVRVVLNGVDTSRFAPSVDGDSVRELHGLRGCFVVLFVGALTRWHRYKGLDVLIEAFARASSNRPRMRLLVVGSGELSAEYRSLARDLRVEERVRFVGHVDDAALPEYYAASDVAVLPSRNRSEGFGLTLLEAMASGRAVVGSSIGGIPELVHSGVDGLLVEPNDPSALASALIELCDRDDERSMMGRAGRAFAELHDWRLVAQEVESVYADSKQPLSGRTLAS